VQRSVPQRGGASAWRHGGGFTQRIKQSFGGRGTSRAMTLPVYASRERDRRRERTLRSAARLIGINARLALKLRVKSIGPAKQGRDLERTHGGGLAGDT
jgi:hypothetical protein